MGERNECASAAADAVLNCSGEGAEQLHCKNHGDDSINTLLGTASMTEQVTHRRVQKECMSM